MTRENASFMVGHADLPGSGPTGAKCAKCCHLLDHYSYRSGRLLDTGVCLKRLDFLGASDGAILARNGDVRAIFAARSTLPPIKRDGAACCEFLKRRKGPQVAA